MAIVLDLLVQFGQMLLVLALAPLLTGYVRKVRAHLMRRQATHAGLTLSVRRRRVRSVRPMTAARATSSQHAQRQL